MKLAIKFGDNDFYNTFIPLLETDVMFGHFKK